MLNWKSSLVGQDIVIRTRRFPVQTLLGAPPGLRTQSRFLAPGKDLGRICKNAVTNIG